MAIWSDNPDIYILVHLMVQDIEPFGTLEEIYQGIELDSEVKKTIPQKETQPSKHVEPTVAPEAMMETSVAKKIHLL